MGKTHLTYDKNNPDLPLLHLGLLTPTPQVIQLLCLELEPPTPVTITKTTTCTPVVRAIKSEHLRSDVYKAFCRGVVRLYALGLFQFRVLSEC